MRKRLVFSVGCAMIGMMWWSTTVADAEIWDYSCAEATLLLKQAQEDVVQKHEQVYQAKLAYRHSPEGMAACRGKRRGFAGGRLHCVTHRSQRGIAIKEVILAERRLRDAVRTFEQRVHEVKRACTTSD